jgi:hypothetical protein
VVADKHPLPGFLIDDGYFGLIPTPEHSAGVDRHALLVPVGSWNAVHEDFEHPLRLSDSPSGSFFPFMGYGLVLVRPVALKNGLVDVIIIEGGHYLVDRFLGIPLTRLGVFGEGVLGLFDGFLDDFIRA